MNSSDSQMISSQPGVFPPIRAGFNVASNHLSLLLVPILLDIWVWFGVHFTLKSQMKVWVSQIEDLISLPATQINEVMDLLGQLFVERLNIMTALRSYPVGIPSLMSSLSPISTPFGNPISIDLGTIGFGILWFIGISLAGIAFGTLYYLLVAQAALKSDPNWLITVKRWPWAFKQVLGLTFVWLGIAIGVTIPFSCIIPVFSAGNISQFLGFLYIGIIAWLFFPLILSAHGIFVNRDKMLVSLKKSIQLSRLTLPSTTIFLLFVLIISQGLGIVWGWPSEDSWIMVIGLAGHSFVATGLLAASFIYYKEADQWAQKFLRQVLLRQYS